MLLRAEAAGINCTLARDGMRRMLADLEGFKLDNGQILQYLDNLPRPGRKPGTQDQRRPAYQDIALECLNQNPRNRGLARDAFISRATAQFTITDTYARKLWYEILKDIFPDR